MSERDQERKLRNGIRENKVKHWDIGMSGELEEGFVRNTTATVQIKRSLSEKSKTRKVRFSWCIHRIAMVLAARGR